MHGLDDRRRGEPTPAFGGLEVGRDVSYSGGVELRTPVSREVFRNRLRGLLVPYRPSAYLVIALLKQIVSPEDAKGGKTVAGGAEAAAHGLPREGPTPLDQRSEAQVDLSGEGEAPIAARAGSCPHAGEIVADNPHRQAVGV